MEITDSESRRMHTTNTKLIHTILPTFLYAQSAGSTFRAPTLHHQSDLTNMATQDPKKQNL